MAKTYPLDIEISWEFQSHEMSSYYSRGHHDKQTFYDAALYEMDNDPLSDNIVLENVEHLYWRWVPSGSEGMVAHESYKPGRGAFPITRIEI